MLINALNPNLINNALLFKLEDKERNSVEFFFEIILKEFHNKKSF